VSCSTDPCSTRVTAVSRLERRAALAAFGVCGAKGRYERTRLAMLLRSGRAGASCEVCDWPWPAEFGERRA